MRVNLNQLRVFYLAARHLSMSAAARALYVSTPAVTMQIKKLENWFGFPLFDRDPGYLRLTERGQDLYEILDPAFGGLDELERYLQDLTRTQEMEIRFGFYHIAGIYFVPDLIAHVRSKFPKLKVKMKIGTMDELLDMLARQKLDIILIIGEAPQKGNFGQKHAFDLEAALVTGSNSEFACLESIPANELGRLPLLLQLKGTGSRQVVLNYLKNHNVEPDILINGLSSDVIKQFLPQMQAGAFIGRYIVWQELDKGILKEIRVPEGLPVCRFHLVYLESPYIPLKIKHFIDGAIGFAPKVGAAEPDRL